MSIGEPSFCEDHGMMVPVGLDFALLDNQGFVVAIAGWEKPGRVMKEYIYAPSAEHKRLVPSPAQALGEWVYQQEQSKRLVEYAEVSWERVFRIDDNRPGHNYTYRVSLLKRAPRRRRKTPVLRPRTVYHFFDDEEMRRDHARLMDFDTVVALMRDPNALLIQDVAGLAGSNLDDPQAKARWDMDNRVVVWDEQAIKLNSRAHKLNSRARQ